jgi:hypothetical protein
MPIEQQLVDRIVAEAIAIVGIGIPARDPEDPLRHQIRQCMGHSRRIAGVRQTGSQSRRQAQATVGRLRQDRAPSELACA